MSTPTRADQEIEAVILDYLDKRFPAQAPFKTESELLDNGQIDSLGFLDLMMFLSEEFGVSLEDEHFTPENLATPSRLVAFINQAA